jgi:hypothetical protein
MKNILQKLNNKKYLSILIGVFVVVFALTFARPALAEILGGLASGLTSLLSWLFVAFINVVGNLLLKAIDILIKIANYGDFLNAPIVEKGWVVVRDLGNIALVFAVLAMAFATIFKRSAYQFSSIMVKILVAALLINFSKFITGLAISVSQVFMMEFVRAFQTAAAGNLTYGFGIHDLLAFRETATGGAFGASQTGLDVNEWSILGAVVLGALMVGVAFVIVMSMAIMLMARILILWFLVMFSPIAFLGSVLPSQMSGYAKQWKDTLVKWLIAGPMVAFMLWLSLAVISEMTEEKRIINLSLQSAASKGTAQNSSDWTAFANKVSGTQNMVDYLVTAGLMIAALMIAGKTSVAGASFANSAFGKIKKFGTDSLAYGKKKATNAAKTGFGTTKVVRKGLATIAPNTMAGKMAQDRINKARGAKVAKRLNRLKKWGAGDETFEYLNKKHQDKLTKPKPKDKDVLARKAGIKSRLQTENPGLNEEELNNRTEGEYAANPVKTKYTQKLDKQKQEIKDYNKDKGIVMDDKDVTKKAKMKVKGGLNPLTRRSTFISEVADKHGVAKASDKNTKMYKAAQKQAKEEHPNATEDELIGLTATILADMQAADIEAKHSKARKSKPSSSGSSGTGSKETNSTKSPGATIEKYIKKIRSENSEMDMNDIHSHAQRMAHEETQGRTPRPPRKSEEQKLANELRKEAEEFKKNRAENA